MAVAANGKKLKNNKGQQQNSPEQQGNMQREETENKNVEQKTGKMEDSDLKGEIIKQLKIAYASELETVINYLSNSIHLDGIPAQEIRESLKEDIQEELGHATRIAERLKILHAAVPGSLELQFDQRKIQPPASTTDVLSVVKGVIDAEKEAIALYEKIIDLADDADDYVTEDMAIQILGDEQHHLREFEGFLKYLSS